LFPVYKNIFFIMILLVLTHFKLQFEKLWLEQFVVASEYTNYFNQISWHFRPENTEININYWLKNMQYFS
jgi:hypothetical protein